MRGGVGVRWAAGWDKWAAGRCRGPGAGLGVGINSSPPSQAGLPKDELNRHQPGSPNRVTTPAFDRGMNGLAGAKVRSSVNWVPVCSLWQYGCWGEGKNSRELEFAKIIN